LENIGASYWQIRDGQWDAESCTWKNSMNGTYVNSDMVSGSGRLLNDGDIITIGDVKLKYDINNTL
jgi:pSer/pThr/pTyr-binding forkhead associated (FHA) protein